MNTTKRDFFIKKQCEHNNLIIYIYIYIHTHMSYSAQPKVAMHCNCEAKKI